MFEGIEYEVGDWCNYIAKDKDGDVYGFEEIPGRSKIHPIWIDVIGTHCVFLGNVDGENWENSLVKV